VKRVALNSVCDFRGRAYDKAMQLPYVGMEDVESNSGKYLGNKKVVNVKSNTYYFNDEYVLYGKLRPYLNKVLSPNFEGHCSTEFITLHPHHELMCEYLGYFLRSKSVTRLINAYTTGTRMPRADVELIKNIQIPLLSLSDQSNVVQRIDLASWKLDEVFMQARKNIENTRLFCSSAISEIIGRGNEYSRKNLGEVCIFVRGPFGGSLKKEYFKPTGYAVYEQRHAIYGNFSNIRYYIDEQKFNEMRRFEVSPGELIMSCSGTMGKVAIIPDDAAPGVINQALLKLTPRKDILLNDYLKYWIESKEFQDALGVNSRGAAIKNVASVKVLKGIGIALPPINAQKDAINEINIIKARSMKLAELYKNKFQKLESLKQSILEQAFSDKVEA